MFNVFFCCVLFFFCPPQAFYFVSAVVMSYAAAFVLAVCVELPMMQLENVLFFRNKKQGVQNLQSLCHKLTLHNNCHFIRKRSYIYFYSYVWKVCSVLATAGIFGGSSSFFLQTTCFQTAGKSIKPTRKMFWSYYQFALIGLFSLLLARKISRFFDRTWTHKLRISLFVLHRIYFYNAKKGNCQKDK